MRRILVKFPSRDRPEDFGMRMQQLAERADHLDGYSVLVSLDADGMEGYDAHMFRCTAIIGSSTSKVDAINRDINDDTSDWDLLLVMSDDMEPQPHWDTMIRDLAADQKDVFLWFSDGRQKRVCTIPCMDRVFYDRTRYVYHSSYRSLYCDDEQTMMALASGRTRKSDMVLLLHQHPRYNRDAARDRLYNRNYLYLNADARNWKERMRILSP